LAVIMHLVEAAVPGCPLVFVDSGVRIIFPVTDGGPGVASPQAVADVPVRTVTVGHLIADLPTGTDWFRFHAR
jgi:hypothetical protein